MRIYDRLSAYKDEGVYPMHMPGHKRSREFRMENPYALDITEIDGFDNLHEPEGILLEGMKRASRIFASDQSFFLVNGSTVGILAGISACTKRGSRILMARNCHISVYHAVILRELRPAYLYPDILESGICGAVSIEEVARGLESYPDTELVVLTSPTYEGIVSGLGSIAELVHRHGIALLVDEAHGAHLAFHSMFPKSAVVSGADLIVQSLHKTLPAFTQSAILHLCGSRVHPDRIKRYLDIYQTTSPSYLLMAGIDSCISFLEGSRKKFEQYCKRVEKFYKDAAYWEHIKLFQSKKSLKDPSKLILIPTFSRMTGKALYDILRIKYHIQPEMAVSSYVLCITSVCDTQEGFDRLSFALSEINRELAEKETGEGNDRITFAGMPVLKKAMSPHEAIDAEGLFPCELLLAEGLISSEFLYLYPPGVPLLVPGEVISKALISICRDYQQKGFLLSGLKDKRSGTILVFR